MNTHPRSIANGKTTIESAWKLCQSDPRIGRNFEEQAKVHGWDVKFAPDSPFWAYWFARNVIKDEWLPGEDVILKDQGVWQTYVQYTENMRACGSLGHTLREDPDFVVDELGVIQGWKPGHGPMIGPGKMAKRTPLVERFGTNDAVAVADRIAKEMQEFQKQRKLRANNSQKDDTDED